jgi:ribonuclease HII
LKTCSSPAGLPLAEFGRLAGVDEVGRGPLAGPVVAAAVILNPFATPAGLDDSKRLSAGRRSMLSDEIRCCALSWSIAWSDPAEIDAINILNATMLAMHRALLGLHVRPNHVQVDGNRCPKLDLGSGCTVEAIVGGDRRVGEISAASIIAKVFRDGLMKSMADRYPGFGFERHKGYPTTAHFEALRKNGPCPIHRRSFRPVSECAGEAA